MIFFIKKLSLSKIIIISFVIPLVSCTTYSCSDPKIRSSEFYLNSAPLVKLKAPEGITLPIQNDIYEIPITSGSGALGKALDISPPE